MHKSIFRAQDLCVPIEIREVIGSGVEIEATETPTAPRGKAAERTSSMCRRSLGEVEVNRVGVESPVRVRLGEEAHRLFVVAGHGGRAAAGSGMRGLLRD